MSGLMLGPIILQTIVGQTASPAAGIPTRADRKGIVLSLSSEQIDAAFNFYTGDQFCDFMNKSVRELAPLLAKAILSSGFSYSINFESLPRELQDEATLKLSGQIAMSAKAETSLLALYTEQNPRSGGKTPRDLVCGTNTKAFNGYPGRWTPGLISIEGITIGLIEQIIIEAGKVKIVPAGANSGQIVLNLVRQGYTCSDSQPGGTYRCTKEEAIPATAPSTAEKGICEGKVDEEVLADCNKKCEPIKAVHAALSKCIAGYK